MFKFVGIDKILNSVNSEQIYDNISNIQNFILKGFTDESDPASLKNATTADDNNKLSTATKTILSSSRTQQLQQSQQLQQQQQQRRQLPTQPSINTTRINPISQQAHLRALPKQPSGRQLPSPSIINRISQPTPTTTSNFLSETSITDEYSSMTSGTLYELSQFVPQQQSQIRPVKSRPTSAYRRSSSSQQNEFDDQQQSQQQSGDLSDNDFNNRTTSSRSQSPSYYYEAKNNKKVSSSSTYNNDNEYLASIKTSAAFAASRKNQQHKLKSNNNNHQNQQFFDNDESIMFSNNNSNNISNHIYYGDNQHQQQQEIAEYQRIQLTPRMRWQNAFRQVKLQLSRVSTTFFLSQLFLFYLFIYSIFKLKKYIQIKRPIYFIFLCQQSNNQNE